MIQDFIAKDLNGVNRLISDLYAGYVPMVAKIEAIGDTDGYIQIGHILIQWGVCTTDASGLKAVDFGIDYATGTVPIFLAFVTHVDTDADIINSDAPTTAGCAVATKEHDGTVAATTVFNFIAIGTKKQE